MSILEELNTVITTVGLPVESGKFSAAAPAEYVVITPMFDAFDVFADDAPRFDVREVRVSLFTRGNYNQKVNQIVKALFSAGFTITERRYSGHDDETGYHGYTVDVAKHYNTDLEE